MTQRGKIDVLATMTPEEYRAARDRLRAEGLWEVGGDPARERRSSAAAERVVRAIRN